VPSSDNVSIGSTSMDWKKSRAKLFLLFVLWIAKLSLYMYQNWRRLIFFFFFACSWSIGWWANLYIMRNYSTIYWGTTWKRSKDKQTLYDYTPKAVPNEHNFIFVSEPQDIILAYLRNWKSNKQSSLSHTILIWHSKLKLEKLFNGVCDNYLLLFYSSMTQFLACVIVRIHMFKLVTIMCMIMWNRRWNCLGHAHYYMLKIRKKFPLRHACL